MTKEINDEGRIIENSGELVRGQDVSRQMTDINAKRPSALLNMGAKMRRAREIGRMHEKIDHEMVEGMLEISKAAVVGKVRVTKLQLEAGVAAAGHKLQEHVLQQGQNLDAVVHRQTAEGLSRLAQQKADALLKEQERVAAGLVLESDAERHARSMSDLTMVAENEQLSRAVNAITANSNNLKKLNGGGS